MPTLKQLSCLLKSSSHAYSKAALMPTLKYRQASFQSNPFLIHHTLQVHTSLLTPHTAGPHLTLTNTTHCRSTPHSHQHHTLQVHTSISPHTTHCRYTPHTTHCRYTPHTTHYRYTPHTTHYRYTPHTTHCRYTPHTTHCRYTPHTTHCRYTPHTTHCRYTPHTTHCRCTPHTTTVSAPNNQLHHTLQDFTSQIHTYNTIHTGLLVALHHMPVTSAHNHRG